MNEASIPNQPRKRNTPVIIGIAIPIAMVLLILLTIYLPKLLIKPEHNFIFVLGPQNIYRYSSPVPGSNMVPEQSLVYEVRDGKVTANTYNYYYYPGERSGISNKLYFYDVKENKSREITLGEAQSFKIDPSIISPDGFEIVPGNRSGGLFPLFYDGNYDYNTMHLKKGISSQKLNMPAYSGSYYYYDNNFRLLGWVVN